MTGPKLLCVGGCGREVGIVMPVCQACKAALDRIRMPPRTTGGYQPFEQYGIKPPPRKR